MKKIIIYIALVLCALKVNAQDITIQTEYPSTVEAGQQFSLTYTINSDGGQFEAPSFEGFIKLMGPQTSYSKNTAIINGKFSSQVAYSFTYYLQSTKPGKFQIPPATYTIKGKSWQSQSCSIEVTAGTPQPQQQASGNSNAPSNAQVETGGSNLFADLQPQKREVYLGEAIPTRLKLYWRVNLAGVSEVKYPSFPNFLKIDIETPQSQATQENLNGTLYGTGTVQQFLLYPQAAGEFTIDPVQVTVLVQQKSGSSDPMFGDFFTTYENVPRAAMSKPVRILVRPLPGVRPAGFSGIVGTLGLKATLSKDSASVNDAINFKITINGNGNLKLASVPQLKLSPDIEVYDPKITDEIRNNFSGSSGQKTFDYLLIPRHYGEFTIPSISYSYFNVGSGRYETLETGEFHLHVKKGNDQNAPGLTVYGGVSKEDVRYVGKDIRFVRNNPGNLARSSSSLLASRAYFASFILALMVFIAFIIIRREHIRRNADITAVRNRKAGKVAAKRLLVASECLKNNETDRFHEEILKALWGYLSDKLNIPVSELTRSNATAALEEKGVSSDMISKLTELLDYCEYARYAPSSVNQRAEETYQGASGFISAVENSIV